MTPSPANDTMARVDVSGCLNGFRVWLLGKPYADFTTLTNASRCASALTTLDALGALPIPSDEIEHRLEAGEREGVL